MTTAGTVPHRRLQLALALVVLIIGGVLVAADVDETRTVLREARWALVGAAVVATAVSYACISVSFAIIGRLVGMPFSLRALTAIGYVTTVVNHIVQSGGVAGLSVRYGLMHRDGVRMRDILTASIIHYYLTSLAMLAMLPLGIVYLLTQIQARPAVTAGVALIALVGLLIFAGATAALLWPPLRRALMATAARIARRFLGRDLGPTLASYDQSLAAGVIALRRRPAVLLAVMLLVVVDWLASALALGYCFEALGRPLTPGVLFTGFVIGTMAGVVSMVPGGMGVLEGSMAGIFALLGVPFGRAVLAVILFRAVYYFLPYVISLGFYWLMAKATRPGPRPAENGNQYANLDAEPRLPDHDQRRHARRPEAGPRYDPKRP